jgi:hypothetical protein
MNDSLGIAPGHRSWSWTDPLILVDVQIDTFTFASTSTLIEKRTEVEYDRMFKGVVVQRIMMNSEMA